MQSKFAPVEATVFNVGKQAYTNATEAEQAGFKAAAVDLTYSGDLLAYSLDERAAVLRFIVDNRDAIKRVINADYSVIRKPAPAPVAVVTNTPRAGEAAGARPVRDVLQKPAAVVAPVPPAAFMQPHGNMPTAVDLATDEALRNLA